MKCKNCGHKLLMLCDRIWEFKPNPLRYHRPATKYGYKHANWSVNCHCGCKKPEPVINPDKNNQNVTKENK
jgi:hypothetical protein